MTEKAQHADPTKAVSEWSVRWDELDKTEENVEDFVQSLINTLHGSLVISKRQKRLVEELSSDAAVLRAKVELPKLEAEIPRKTFREKVFNYLYNIKTPN